MPAGDDPFAVLGVSPTASDAEIHAAYRAAVRRTHPDAGGSAAAFEATQSAYVTLRDPAARARLRAPGHAQAPPQRDPSAPAPDPAQARRRMDDLLAESRRLEDEARRLAGLPPRYEPQAPVEDSIGTVLSDAGTGIVDAVGEGARGLRRLLRRIS